MRTPLCYLIGIFLFALLLPRASAEQFTVFPDRKEMHSPDGRFVVRSVEHSAAANEFSGVFRTLVLEEVTTGKVRKLYDYVGRVAVAWSGNDFIIVNDYVNKKTSRALVFPVDPARDVLVLDKVQMSSLIPDEQSVHLQQNDHVFVEVSSVEGTALKLRVWGYGRRDASGFRYVCRYDLPGGTAVCQ
jgi:hypothetical protein